MDFFEVFENRRSCHHFLPNEDITEDDFKKIVDKVRLTPSGYNAQPWEFIMVKNPETRKEIRTFAYDQAICEESSALVIVLADTMLERHADEIGKQWLDSGLANEHKAQSIVNALKGNRPPEKSREMAVRNAAFAAMNFMLVAEAMGFATCPMMGFSQPKLKALLEIPEDRAIALMIAIGKPDRENYPERLPRKDVDSLIHKEKFGESF